MLYCVLGAGEMPAKELNATLTDLKKRCEADDVQFWFAVHAKAEPTTTDKTMLAWLHKHDTWYEVITDDADAVDSMYSESQKTHLAKRMAPAIVKLMQEGPEEGEEAQLLALFASDDYSSPDDTWLNDVGRAVQDAGFIVKALNDGLIEMDFSDVTPPEAEVEEEAVPTKTKKAAAASPIEEEEEVAAVPELGRQLYTRDELEEMSLDQLKEIAAKRGIELAPRTRIQTYINTILGEGAEVEVEEITPDDEAVEEEYGAPTLVEDLDVMSPAMLIVVYNGSVVARSITSEHALTLISQPV